MSSINCAEGLKIFSTMKAAGRSNLYEKVCRIATPEERALAEKRVGYKMPPGYISRRSLVEIGTGSLMIARRASCPAEEVPEDVEPYLLFSKTLNKWAENSSPLYCVAPKIIEALIYTNALDRPEILKGFNPPLRSLLIAVPEHSICCPQGRRPPNTYIDHLLVTCIEPTDIRDTLFLGVMTTDSDGGNWTLGIGIDKSDNTVNDLDIEDATEEENQLFKKIRNLVVSVLLLLNTSASSIISEVLPSETADDSKKPKGFGKQPASPPPKYPRWIGKNYQIKSRCKQAVKTPTGTHASPRAHWRCGHFRKLEPGEGKKWTEPKMLWIEPVMINFGIE